jgi:L-rhamnose mutarotase
MKQYCLALDLKDDATLIAAYEEWHRNIWPEVVQSIRNAGIEKMEIFRSGNRLFMIVQAADNFSFESKAAADATNEKVQEWEQLMWNFQQPLPGSKPGEKWILMDKIFTV